MHPASCLLTILLLVVTCLCSDVLCSANDRTDYRKPLTVQIKCCTAVSSAKLKYPITEYKIQHQVESCVYAVIFRTENRESYCCDPEANWVIKKVAKMSNGEVKLSGGKKRGKGGRGGKKQKNRNNEKRKSKHVKAPVTPLWLPSTAAAIAPTLR